MVNTVTMTSLEILQTGLDVLSRELGSVGMTRFLQMLERGKGDYTAEREQWLPVANTQTLIEMMRQADL